MTVDPRPDARLAERLSALHGLRPGSVAAALADLSGDPRASLAITPDHDATDRRFEVGSVTKGLTGMLLADAIDRGEVTLQTSAAELAPELAGARAGSVTLGELCTHRSGLPRLPARLIGPSLAAQFRGANPYAGQDVTTLLAAVRRAHLRHPGAYRYSNLGGALAGQLLAAAAGTTYERLLAGRLLGPLGLTDTTVATDAAPAPPGHAASGRPSAPWVLGGFAPAGGVVSTISDLACLLVALLDGSAPGSVSIQAIPGAIGPRPGTTVGMFWVREGELVWHNGMTGGYAAFLAIAPGRRRGVAVLADCARAAEQRETALALLDG